MQNELRRLIEEGVDARVKQCAVAAGVSERTVPAERLLSKGPLLSAELLPDCPQPIRAFHKKLVNKASKFGPSDGDDELQALQKRVYELQYTQEVMKRYFMLPVAKMLEQPQKLAEAKLNLKSPQVQCCT